MDERLRFVARLLDGEKMAALCREFDISRKTGYKIFQRYQDCRPRGADRSQPPALPAGQPAALPDRDADRAAASRSTRAGARRRSARSCAGSSWVCRPRRSAPCTPCSIATAWSSRGRRTALQGAGHAPCPGPASPTTCGAPTTRASSCSPIGATATRSPSPTSPAATCSPARPSPPPRSLRLHRLRARLQGVRPARGHPHRQRRPLRQPQRPLRPEQARRSGGCASASRSSASSPATRSRTAATSACT